jgi:hypothetical protein
MKETQEGGHSPSSGVAHRNARTIPVTSKNEDTMAIAQRTAEDLLSDNPAALQLRYLQTLADVGKGEGSTVLLPLPLDVIGSVVRGIGHNGRGNGTSVVQVD